jgi:hypothetical protein
MFAAGGLNTLSVYPNPFSPARDINVNINYDGTTFFGGTSVAVTSKLKIYTIHGRKVLDQTAANKFSKDILVWNGRDDNGVLMPSDLYFFMLDLTDSLVLKLVDKPAGQWEGITVNIKSGPESFSPVVTATDGSFSFPNITKTGTYVLEAKKVDYLMVGFKPIVIDSMKTYDIKDFLDEPSGNVLLLAVPTPNS